MVSKQRYIDKQYERDWEGDHLTELFDAEIAGIDEDWSDDYKLRKELDFRTGRVFTRLQSNKLREAIPEYNDEKYGKYGKIIHYGSCMFPVLGFVCQRFYERENFRPERFWKIKMNHTVGNLTTEFTWQREKEQIDELNKARDIIDICKNNNLAIVKKVETRKKIKTRPLPLNTAEMLIKMSPKLNIRIEEVMKLAKNLCKRDLISDPKTETNIYPANLDLKRVVEQQREHEQWGDFAKNLADENELRPSKGDTSYHEFPIYPLKYTKDLQGKEKTLYEFIVRHFLATVSKDAVQEETVVQVEIEANTFVANGLKTLERNFLEVYDYDECAVQQINDYEEGRTFVPTNFQEKEDSTTPPQLLTDVDLVDLMSRNSIGRDSTYYEHIKRSHEICDYTQRYNDIYLTPTPLGLGIMEGYNQIFTTPEESPTNPKLRATFEESLANIRHGSENFETVKAKQIDKYRKIFETVSEKFELIITSVKSRIYVKPNIIKHLKDTTVEEGASLHLEVEVETIPEVVALKLLRNGREVFSDPRIKITRQITKKQRYENYHLTVDLIKYEERGEYEVQITNKYGNISSKSQVTVHKVIHTDAIEEFGEVVKKDLQEKKYGDDDGIKIEVDLEGKEEAQRSKLGLSDEGRKAGTKRKRESSSESKSESESV